MSLKELEKQRDELKSEIARLKAASISAAVEGTPASGDGLSTPLGARATPGGRARGTPAGASEATMSILSSIMTTNEELIKQVDDLNAQLQVNNQLYKHLI